MSVHDSTHARRLIAWKKWSVAGGVFIAGYTLYLLTRGMHGFFPELIHHAGLFLSAVVAVHFIYELLVKKEEQAAMRQEIGGAVERTINAFLPSYERWGFHGFVETLDFDRLFGTLQKDDELLWLDTYAPSRGVLLGHIEQALARGVKIRMLVISPAGPTAAMRAREISQPGFTEQSFLGDLRSFVEALRPVAARNAGLEVRLYDDLPSVPMYLQRRGGVPLQGLTSYFLCGASEQFAHARWSFSSHGMLRHFAAYFDQKWARAKPLSVV